MTSTYVLEDTFDVTVDPYLTYTPDTPTDSRTNLAVATATVSGGQMHFHFAQPAPETMPPPNDDIVYADRRSPVLTNFKLTLPFTALYPTYYLYPYTVAVQVLSMTYALGYSGFVSGSDYQFYMRAVQSLSGGLASQDLYEILDGGATPPTPPYWMGVSSLTGGAWKAGRWASMPAIGQPPDVITNSGTKGSIQRAEFFVQFQTALADTSGHPMTGATFDLTIDNALLTGQTDAPLGATGRASWGMIAA